MFWLFYLNFIKIIFIKNFNGFQFGKVETKRIWTEVLILIGLLALNPSELCLKRINCYMDFVAEIHKFY
jgi:hypothetical protein